ncbi:MULTISPECIES: glycoside hydrolase family 18 chitinase [unclassified Crossiella]|uniref:glycoside hydrolase family 18 chitinase n=1 Tax=unclassified Crossiella TaxID=2620835 RepID=UPI001FFEF301|nr:MULTISPECIES: glycoside hydrolase family 18 chitinase [unclassified Crossiella]MCK2238320.1 glycoside hydrolase family 18 chitinase [Crossiella sp. S99.2]MCK2256360.1 glycoside hydrolase family 18 chitinase [Crossiella sp. S99.1]
MPIRRWRATAMLTALLLTLVGLAALPAHAATGVTAKFTKTSGWDTGYEGRFTVTNNGPASIASWTVEFDLPTGQRLGSLWEATHTVSGQHVTAKSQSWNGNLAAGQSASFGFGVQFTGAYADPSGCKVNGASCDGGSSEPDTQAPSAPGQPAVTSVSSSSISLSWPASTDNVGVTGYEILGASGVVATATGASVTVTGLTADTSYSFTVRAKDAAGNTSAASPSVSGKTATGGGDPGPGGNRKVGYYTQWSVYDRAYHVKNLDTSGTAARLTHLNYAFGNVNAEGKCFQVNQAGQGDSWADYQRRLPAEQAVDGVADVYNQPLAGNLNQLKKLKAKYPNLRVLISLGGWTWSKYFSNAALTDASRKAHVSSCIDMWIKGNLPVMGGDPQGGPGSGAGIFDGVDLDWEWPGSEGNTGNIVRPEDKRNFTLLAAEYRTQLAALGASTGKKYDLTAFLPADPRKVDAGFEVGEVVKNLTFGNVQGYDFHGGWEKVANQQSSVKLPAGDPSPTAYSDEIAVDAWLSRGAPANWVVLGVPFYSRGWTGVTNANNGLFQAATGPAPGTFEAGIEDYKKIKNLIASGYTVHRDTTAGHAWLFNGSTFWTFDDATEITRKVNWAKSKGLGGAMIWSLDGDTADGELIKALATALG